MQEELSRKNQEDAMRKKEEKARLIQEQEEARKPKWKLNAGSGKKNKLRKSRGMTLPRRRQGLKRN